MFKYGRYGLAYIYVCDLVYMTFSRVDLLLILKDERKGLELGS